MATRKSGTPRARQPKVPRLAFFFGAGAEVAYGMPVGGRFALEILRAKRPKDEFKRDRDRIAAACTPLYRKWLPDNFAKAPVVGLGKPEQNRVFGDSLQNGYTNVISSLNAYDESARRFLSRTQLDERQVAVAFSKLSGGLTFGETPYRKVSFNKSIADEPASLFGSKYFSAVALLAKNGTQKQAMTDLARGTIQFYLGAHGQSAMEAMTVNPLVNIPDDNPAFAELGQMFEMNPLDAGIAAFSAVMEAPYDALQTTGESFFLNLATAVLESTVEQFLDYRRMMDELLPALYRPKDHWSRFTKIVQFLMATRTYVLQQQASALENGDGYYHDLAEAIRKGLVSVTTVGTSNYTALCGKALQGVFSGPIRALNGSLDEYLDPYKNEIVGAGEVENSPRFLVPFLFTQSGVKPLTSVEISRRYVEYFDHIVDSGTVVIAGFGFNGDDGHINALFRQAIDEHDVRLVVLQHDRDASLDAIQQSEGIAARLRIDKIENLTVLLVDDARKVEGIPWFDAVLAVT